MAGEVHTEGFLFKYVLEWFNSALFLHVSYCKLWLNHFFFNYFEFFIIVQMWDVFIFSSTHWFVAHDKWASKHECKVQPHFLNKLNLFNLFQNLRLCVKLCFHLLLIVSKLQANTNKRINKDFIFNYLLLKLLICFSTWKIIIKKLFKILNSIMAKFFKNLKLSLRNFMNFGNVFIISLSYFFCIFGIWFLINLLRSF